MLIFGIDLSRELIVMKKRLLPTLVLLYATFILSAQAVDVNLYRTYDGRFNNVNNQAYGATHTALQRLSGDGYIDGASVPVGVDRPNPRTVSNALFAQDGLLNDPVGLSDYTWVFGQFMDHDVALTEEVGEDFNIPVPAGDPDFDPMFFGTVEIPLTRNLPIIGTGTAPGNPRQYHNDITAFIDGSGVYGSDLFRASWLRAFVDGKMKTSSGNMLPYNTTTGEIDGPEDSSAPHMANGTGFAGPLFVAGDVRANENPLLASCHLIFIREHNRQCARLKAFYPDWNDEQLYQHARKIVGGLIQSVAYDEWLPTMGVDVAVYTGYNATVVPQLANVFSAAAFRVGHTLLNGNIRRIDAEGAVIDQGNMTLREAFFNPEAYDGIGMDPYLRGMAEQTQQRMDNRVVDDVRNFLFGPPGAGGLDLASINIARGRDRGLNTYNAIRQAYGLSTYSNFNQINPAPEVHNALAGVYDNDLGKLDPWVAMLAERSMDGSIFGPTIRAIMRKQFTDLRDGDRFFYLNDPVLSPEEKQMISDLTFRDIIMYNSGVTLMQDNVFESMPFSEICGSATVRADGVISVHTSGELLPNVTVSVLGEDGEANASGATSDLGFYNFNGLPACDQTMIRAEKTDEWIAGVDIVDVVAIRGALLDIRPFSTPYQYLAADANADGTLDIQDVVALYRLLLAIDEELVDGAEPWAFVAGGYEFENPNWPFFDEQIPSVIDFRNVSPVEINQGFVAYKRGDVNADASLTNNRAPGLLVTVPETNIVAGETRLVEITLSGEDLAGFDVSLTGQGLEILRVVSADLSSEHFLLRDGNLHLVSAEANQNSYRLAVEVRATTAGSVNDLITLAQENQSLSVDSNGLPRSVVMGAVAGAMEVVESSVYPNPFTEAFHVDFSQPLNQDSKVVLMDVSGREVYTSIAAEGASSLVVNGLDLPAGNYFLRLTDRNGRLVLMHKLSR